MNSLLVAAALGSQLINGNFSAGATGWSTWGGHIIPSATGKGHVAYIKNEKPAWSGIDQKVLLPRGAATIRLSGRMKTKGVQPGKELWERARVAIEFHDRAGERVGGWPTPAIQLSGDNDWRDFERTYLVPGNTHLVMIQAALGNCIGEVWVENMALIILDENGKHLKAGTPSGPMDKGRWYTLPAGSAGGHFVDWSELLHKPAGKHGFVENRDGRFVFADGTRARFWGTNLVGRDCFPDHKTADSLALKLSRMGVNLVRLHHMDAPWSEPNLFGPKGGPGRSFDSLSLDRMDYLIAAFKKQGIYTFLDLLVHRDFVVGKDVPHALPDLGGKQVGIFARELIDLQKDFNTRLFTHVNPYTKLAYKDEPAIVGSAFINESAIYSHFTGNMVEGFWWQRLDSLWRAQGGAPGELASFDMDWSGPRPKLRPGKVPGNHQASLKFMMELEGAYYREMRDHLRGLGVKIPLTGSTLPLAILPYQANNARYGDFIASNEYWDHPQVWKINNDWVNRIRAPFDNQSQLLTPARSVLTATLRFRVAGKPYMTTEWNHCYPNEHVLEGVPLMAAYGALQGYDGLLQFDFGPAPLGAVRIESYQTSTMPEHIANWVAGVPMFLRGDVREAPASLVEGVAKEALTTLPAYSSWLDENWQLAYIARISKNFDGPSVGSPQPLLDRYHNAAQKTIRSQTGELELDYGQGFMSIRTPRVQGGAGFWAKDGKATTLDLPSLTVSVSNPHASVLVVSRDTSALDQTKSMYLVATGPSRMKGQKYNHGRTQLVNVGAVPVEMQVIEGTVVFKGRDAASLRVRPLSPSGKPGKAIALKKVPGGAQLDLSLLKSPVALVE